jgi:hypothetical protein
MKSFKLVKADSIMALEWTHEATATQKIVCRMEGTPDYFFTRAVKTVQEDPLNHVERSTHHQLGSFSVEGEGLEILPAPFVKGIIHERYIVLQFIANDDGAIGSLFYIPTVSPEMRANSLKRKAGFFDRWHSNKS